MVLITVGEAIAANLADQIVCGLGLPDVDHAIL